MAFEVGDIVKLKSGGPQMTVSGRDIGQVCVVWFDAHDRLLEEWLPPEVLEHAEVLEIDDMDGFYEDGIYEDLPDLTDEESDVLVVQSGYYKNGR